MDKKITLIHNGQWQYAGKTIYRMLLSNRIASFALSLLLLLLNTLSILAQTTSTFTTSGTWKAPCGVTSVSVQVWGGGGSGASDIVNDNIGVGGGGGGGYSSATLSVTPGSSITVVVGTGGLAPTVSPFGGVAGGQSSFGALIAGGGLGGATNGVGGAGGTGTTSNGTNGSNNSLAVGGAGGAGGTPGGGAGGAGGADGFSGSNGLAPGGGGGGAGDAANGGSGGRVGGNGARGEVRVTYTCPPTPIALAGPDQTLTGTNITTTLAANPAACVGACGTTCGVGAWTVVSGTANIADPSSPTSSVTVAPCSSATLRWTINNSPCGTSSDDVVITSSGMCPNPCEPNSTGTGFPITNVTFAGINNSVASPSADYENFTVLAPAQVDEGGLYNLSVSTTSNGANLVAVVAFFDWNGDGDFNDAGETEQIGTGSATSFTVTEPIRIPTCATGTLVRMRIMSLRTTIVENTIPCYNSTSNMQAEDYLVQINSPISTCNSTGNTNLSSPSCTLEGMNPYAQINTTTGGGGSCLGTSLPFTFSSVPSTCSGQYAGAAGTNFGCLLSQPNPSWFSFEVAASGSLCLNATTAPAVDIDFALWGPISDCDIVTPGFQYPADCLPAPLDCDYTTATGGQIGSTGTTATAGQRYILVITNFSGTTTNITLAQCGTATFTCPPTPCTNPPAAPVVADGTRCGTGTVTFTVTTGCATGTLTYYEDPGLTIPWTGTGNTTPTISTTTTYYATCESAANCKSPYDAVRAIVQNCCADNGTTTNVTCP